MTEILYFAIFFLGSSLIATIIIGLLKFNKKNIIIVELQEVKKNLLEKNIGLEERIHFYEEKEKQHKELIAAMEKDALAMDKSIIILNGEIDQLKNSCLEKIQSLNREFDIKSESLINEKSQAIQNFHSYKEELEKYKEKINEELKMQFSNIANNLLRDNNKSFAEASQKDLSNILNPLQEKIKTFQEQVEKNYIDTSKEQFSLKNEIKNLMEETNKAKLSADTLANALKGNNKILGNWGEIMLINILENSGLQKNRDYIVQTAIDNNSIPDVIVNLPDDRHIVIDAKTTFGKYEDYCSASDEKSRQEFLQSFIVLMKRHIISLSKKAYQHNNGINTPNFVLMFIPIEAAYILALNADSNVYNFALQNNIFLVSPTSLMVTLRTIAHVWTKEYQNRNAIEIAEKAGLMYDKFVALVSKIQEIGKNIKKADENYEDAFKYLSIGNGNLCKKAEELRKIGAKTKKELPSVLICDDAM